MYLLIERKDDKARVVGYYAISPAQVVREDVDPSVSKGRPRTVPAWRIGKLAIHVDLRADPKAQWGRQLLRDALETIVRGAEAGGGKLIVVDADNAAGVNFYLRNGFRTAGTREGLALFMKVPTARKALDA